MVNIMKLKFIRMGINGEGIGYHNRMPVFCDGVLPNETAEIEITDQKERYAKAKLVRLIERSPDRTKPVCAHQKDCGGCPLMCVKPRAQAKYKTDLLAEALYKYGNVKRHFIRNMRQSEDILGFRNQCKLPFGEENGKLVCGMYKSGTNHFVTINDCPVHDPLLEKARKAVLEVLNAYHMHAYDKKTKRGMRYLVMRVMDAKIQCTLITGQETIAKRLIEDIMAIEGIYSLHQSVNTDPKAPSLFGSAVTLLAGEETLPLTIGDITLALSPDSFFQLNTKQAEKMYETAVSKIDRCDLLVEAYCGIGAMSLMAHKKADRIVGIEYVENAVINARANAENNRITNTEFICADAADGLYKAARTQQVDILLADPPRSGMDEKMIEAILRTLPEKIIYISCNPATLAKNLKELKKEYLVQTVIPFDLFPQTPLVEAICVLTRG